MINPFLIARVAVPVPLPQYFDYSIPETLSVDSLSVGMRVKIPFRQQEIVGILVELSSSSEVSLNRLKPLIQSLDDNPLIPKDIFELCRWAADYYHYPIGEVLSSALPVLLRQGKPAVLSKEDYWFLSSEGKEVDLTSLKRAPRQIELLKFLAMYPEGVTAKQLRTQGFTKPLIQALVKKNWVAMRRESFTFSEKVQEPLLLNEDQDAALQAILSQTNLFQVFLLEGVTGSGKTEVYLQAISHILNEQKQVLVLVPEIGLTPQTIQRFRERFSVPIVALHSGLSEKERLNAWLSAKEGDAKIVIGTRSAIFSPFKNLGLIVVDEEHDLSFKQQEGFRYHARDLGIMRARFNNIPIVLGSATPSLETLHNANNGRYQYLRLSTRAGLAQLPQFHVLDIRKLPLEEGISKPLLQEIKNHLQEGNQVMLFLNRRGFAPVLMCHACGWMIICKRCDIRMTYHQNPPHLHCHHCDAQRAVFKTCQHCGDHSLYPVGLGTERLESALKKYFPAISIARIDRDNTQRKGSLEELLEEIQQGKHQILIGTQMLAKGHHFPNVTLVGIIDADGGFFSVDFRALERMGQLLLQVAGRAGRAEKKGHVFIQTHHPDHPLLNQLLQKSYYHFSLALLKEREQAHLPPYIFFALFRVEAYDKNHALTFLQKIKKITGTLSEGISVLGPAAAPMPRRSGRHRMQLLIHALQRPALQHFLKFLLPEIEKIPDKKHVRWSLDVDPLEMF